MSDANMHRSAWPESLRAKFGPDLLSVVTALKRANSIDAAAEVLAPYPLTQAERIQALQITPYANTSPSIKTFRLSRAKFYAAAWSVGAAYRQMARMLGISHQTIHTAAGRLLGPSPERVSSHPLTDEQCEALYLEWQKHTDLDVLPLIEVFIDVLNNWDKGDV